MNASADAAETNSVANSKHVPKLASPIRTAGASAAPLGTAAPRVSAKTGEKQ